MLAISGSGYRADRRTRDGEKDNHDGDEGGSQDPPDPMFRRSDAQVAPDHLLGQETELTGGQLLVRLRLPPLHQLPGILGVLLGIESDENGTDQGALAGPVPVLFELDLGDQLGQVFATVGDGVDLTALLERLDKMESLLLAQSGSNGLDQNDNNCRDSQRASVGSASLATNMPQVQTQSPKDNDHHSDSGAIVPVGAKVDVSVASTIANCSILRSE